LSFALQATARLNAVEIPVDVDLEQYARVVSRPARQFWLNAVKTQLAQIDLINEIVKALRQQNTL